MPPRYEHIFNKDGKECKRCSKCEEYKLLDEFNNYKKTYDGKCSKCRNCCRKVKLTSKGVNVNSKLQCIKCKKQKTYDKFHNNNSICIECIEIAKQNDMKLCFGCNEIKFNAEFHNSLSRANGKQTYCIECHDKNKKLPKYKLKHKEYMKEYKKLPKYKTKQKEYMKTYVRKNKRKRKYIEDDDAKETPEIESNNSISNSFDSDEEDENILEKRLKLEIKHSEDAPKSKSLFEKYLDENPCISDSKLMMWNELKSSWNDLHNSTGESY